MPSPEVCSYIMLVLALGEALASLVDDRWKDHAQYWKSRREDRGDDEDRRGGGGSRGSDEGGKRARGTS